MRQELKNYFLVEYPIERFKQINTFKELSKKFHTKEMTDEEIEIMNVIIFPQTGFAYIIGSSRKDLYFSILVLNDDFLKKRQLEQKQ